MAPITRAEIKTILNLTDNFVRNEEITFSSVSYSVLANKGNVEIVYVNADDDNSTVHTTEYDTTDYYTTEDGGNNTLIRRIDTGSIADTETVYVQYTYNDYDELIDTLIPQVTYDICDYLNNWFLDEETEYSSGGFKIIERSGTSHPQITDTSNQEFEKWGFQANMDIAVTGTPRNSGIYTISAMDSEVMKLSSGDTLLVESDTVEYGGRVIQLNRIKWPPALKRIIAYIVWYNIDRAKKQDIRSKSIGPSSITYESLDSGGYPPSIYNALNKFKNMKTI